MRQGQAQKRMAANPPARGSLRLLKLSDHPGGPGYEDAGRSLKAYLSGLFLHQCVADAGRRRRCAGCSPLAFCLAYLPLGCKQKPFEFRFAYAIGGLDEGDPFGSALAPLRKILQNLIDLQQMQSDDTGNVTAVGKVLQIGKVAEGLLLHLAAYAGFLIGLYGSDFMRLLAFDRPTLGNDPATAFPARDDENLGIVLSDAFSIAEGGILFADATVEQSIGMSGKLGQKTLRTLQDLLLR